MANPPPLILCVEKPDGQEVAIEIEPNDNFHTFLVKAKNLLGYDVDLNSITRNQPVSLTDNVYKFLLNSEQGLISEINGQMVTSANNENFYVLDDGTQIRASQIHFDNDDPPVDLTAEQIPFVKHTDINDEIEPNEKEVENKLYNIVESPVRYPNENNSFILPFKLVNNYNKTSGFEAQFQKYLEASNKTYATLNTVTNRNKSPRSLIRDNYKKYDDSYQRNNENFTHYTREDILNMFKDAPVPSLPYDNQGHPEKRRHVRKSDLSRLVHKNYSKPISYIDVDGVLISEAESQNCFICGKYVEHNVDKLYLFDVEDQRLHRSSPQKKLSTQLKIICEQCLEENFKPCRMKSPNQSLNPDEFLVIRNNQQYIFQKTNSRNFNIPEKSDSNTANISVYYKNNDKSKYADVGLEYDNEINNHTSKDNNNITVIKDERKESSSDVEIIENQPEFDDIENLEESDVIEFLGKYEGDSNEVKELKCRFCEKVFKEISEVVEHGDAHKHVLDDDEVFPCPLCDYGYANFKWLKGHLQMAHDRAATNIKIENKTEEEKSAEGEDQNKDKTVEKSESAESPVSSRTRNAVKNTSGDGEKDSFEKTEDGAVANGETSKFLIKTEVKQEAVESSDDEIWIVQTADDDADQQLKIILDAAKNDKDKLRCEMCGQLFPSVESMTSHKCRRRTRKRRPSKDESVICVPTKEDFLKRAQGRLRLDDSGDNDLLIVRPRRKKNKEPTSNPQIVTCNDCNESFTSKVRLKFHMQFHESTSMLTTEGEYQCTECDNTKFQTETALFDHVHFQHHKQRRWQCPVASCGKTFYLRATLTKHSRSHTDTRRYACATCGKRFLDKQTLDEHGVTHLQIKPFQCHICLKQLTRRSRLRMHLRAHEEELCPRLVLVCAVCSRAFRDDSDVQEHLTRFPECIEQFAKELKEEEAVTVQLSPTSGLVRHTVQIVESPKLSKPIRRQASGPEAEALLATVSDGARPIIRVVEIEKAFRCEFCEDVFYSESGLNTHRVIHKNVKNPFTCHICKVSFATYSRCTTHKTTHGFYKRSLADAKKQLDKSTQEAGPSSTGILGYGDFPVVKHFLCEDCGRSYLHWTYLQVHRRMKHANENYLHKCNQCELSFPNSWSLSYHRKKHHGKTETEDPKQKEKDDYRIPCRDCEEVLPNKTALYKHRKKEHSDMSLQLNGKDDNMNNVGVQYGCGGCGRSQTNYSDHTSTRVQDSNLDAQYVCSVCKKTDENPGGESSAAAAAARSLHACSWCGRAFRTQSMLAEHARTHTGERPFPCDVCGVAFRRSTAMRNHRLIHSGVRAWACARCPKRFRIRSDLRTHFRLKHPASLLVIEVAGLNPSPEEVMEKLTANNISHDKVIEINKMSFLKGTSSIVPNSFLALDMLSHVPRTQVACSRSRPDRPFELYQPARRGRGIAKNPRKPKILQRGPTQDSVAYSLTVPTSAMPAAEVTVRPLHVEEVSTNISTTITKPQENISYPVTVNVTGTGERELNSLNVQLLVRDGVLLNGNQMVQLQLDDSMLLE